MLVRFLKSWMPNGEKGCLDDERRRCAPTGVQQAYKSQAADTKMHSLPIFAFVSLRPAGNKAFQTPPAAVEPNATSRLGATPISFSLGVNGLPQRQYDCQVTVLDPSSGKVAFWRAPILLVP
jgi:hypothetical protein